MVKTSLHSVARSSVPSHVSHAGQDSTSTPRHKPQFLCLVRTCPFVWKPVLPRGLWTMSIAVTSNILLSWHDLSSQLSSHNCFLSFLSISFPTGSSDPFISTATYVALRLLNKNTKKTWLCTKSNRNSRIFIRSTLLLELIQNMFTGQQLYARLFGTLRKVLRKTRDRKFSWFTDNKKKETQQGSSTECLRSTLEICPSGYT